LKNYSYRKLITNYYQNLRIVYFVLNYYLFLKTNELLNKQNYSLRKFDFLVTLFDFKDKEIILKSYLVNKNKSSDNISYKNIDTVDILDKTNYQIAIYNNLLNSNKYLDNTEINNFVYLIVHLF
jgi:hypothetical protein